MKHHLQLISRLFFFSFAIVALSACGSSKETSDVAPEFSLPSPLDNKVVKLSDHKGKLVLLNFWASWCPPCRAEIPGFINVQKENKDKGFTFIGLAMEDQEASSTYAKEVGINYPIAFGAEAVHKVISEYGNPDGGLPYTVVIGADQKIISKFSGFLSEDKLEEILAKNLPK